GRGARRPERVEPGVLLLRGLAGRALDVLPRHRLGLERVHGGSGVRPRDRSPKPARGPALSAPRRLMVARAPLGPGPPPPRADVASQAAEKKVNLDYAYATGTGKGTGVVVLGAGKGAAKLAKSLK